MCRICGNRQNNRLHRGREMMFGTRDGFEYIECGQCGTIQLATIPDLSRYYPPRYYSFQVVEEALPPHLKTRIAARAAANYYGRRRNLLGKYVVRTRGWARDLFPEALSCVNLGITVHSSILDVGCGGGQLLQRLRYFGFKHLIGVDAFIESPIAYANGVKVLKCELADLEPSFDLIMLHHSFEHVWNPKETLREIHRLLKRGQYALISMPVVAYAWAKYGVDWVQLDAPRHVFLYTEGGFRKLVEAGGFTVAAVVYDSGAFQFWGSEQYRFDIPLSDARSVDRDPRSGVFTEKQMRDWEVEAQRLNDRGEGDQARFYLRRR